MSTHDQHHDDHAELQRDPDPASLDRDSKADAIAAFCAVAIAVTGALYFISQHHN